MAAAGGRARRAVALAGLVFTSAVVQACGGEVAGTTDGTEPNGNSDDCQDPYLDTLEAAADRFDIVAADAVERLAPALAAIAGEPVPDTPTANDISALCAAAEAALEAELNRAGEVTVTGSPGICRVPHDARLDCDQRCLEAASCSCDVGTVETRCDPLALGGRCTGTCSGRCWGSAGAPVDCPEQCDGICSGTCDGECTIEDATGHCNGNCDGSCVGTCDGACATASTPCDGTCVGVCDGERANLFCEKPLDGLGCNCPAATDCLDACDALAQLHAECTPPTASVTGAVDSAFASVFESHFPDVMWFLAQSEHAMEGASNLLAAFASLPATSDRACVDRLRAREPSVGMETGDLATVLGCFASTNASVTGSDG